MMTPDTAIDGPLAWARLSAACLLAAIASVGMWSAPVFLPVLQGEFGIDRGSASLAYTASTLGFGIGGMLMGRMADRFGVMIPVLMGAILLASGFALAAMAQEYWHYVVAQAVFAGMLGASASFSPLLADITLWFRRRRGIAVALVASGNYLGGVFWPPFLQWVMADHGWRNAHLTVAVLCLALMLPLTLFMRRRPPVEAPAPHAAGHATPNSAAALPASPAMMSRSRFTALPSRRKPSTTRVRLRSSSM